MRDYYIESLKRIFDNTKYYKQEFYTPCVTEFDITQLPKEPERPIIKIKSIKVFEE